MQYPHLRNNLNPEARKSLGMINQMKLVDTREIARDLCFGRTPTTACDLVERVFELIAQQAQGEGTRFKEPAQPATKMPLPYAGPVLDADCEEVPDQMTA